MLAVQIERVQQNTISYYLLQLEVLIQQLMGFGERFVINKPLKLFYVFSDFLFSMCLSNAIKFSGVDEIIEMSEGTSHFADKMFPGNWVHIVVMVDNVLNFGYTLSFIMVVQIIQTTGWDLRQRVLELEGSLVNF